MAALSILIRNVATCNEHLVVRFEEARALILVDVALLTCAKHSKVLTGAWDFFTEEFEHDATFFVAVWVFELVSDGDVLEALHILLVKLRKLVVVSWLSFSLIFVVSFPEEVAKAAQG